MDILIQDFETDQMKKEVPEFNVGDTVRISIRIIEGDKERTQVFQGTVIARKGSGLSETFSLHRVSYGEGMERVFFLHSPRISKIEVVKKGAVRRSKLYYLRGKKGKAAKVKEKIGAAQQQNREYSRQTDEMIEEETETEILTTESVTAEAIESTPATKE